LLHGSHQSEKEHGPDFNDKSLFAKPRVRRADLVAAAAKFGTTLEFRRRRDLHSAYAGVAWQ